MEPNPEASPTRTGTASAPEKRRALVTGASAGIGKEIAHLLLIRGWAVWGTSRVPGELWQKEDFHPVFLDFDKESSLEAVSGLLTHGPTGDEGDRGFDLLVNNAGSGVISPFTTMSPADIERQLKLLASGPIRLMHAALPPMLERGGAIINISSLSARLPIPYFAPYNAGKAALSAFSQSLLLEFGSRSKVQLLDVQLGDVRTGFNERANCPARGRDPAFDRFFKRLDALISTAPRAAKVAQKIVKTLETGRSGTMVAGGFFQKWLAPLGSRLLPAACLRRVTRRYYHLE